MEAKALVLMEKENGVLTNELGSYEIDEGLEYVFKANVENEVVNLFLTTDRDVEDEEYNKIFDEYNSERLQQEGYEVEEIEEEYNPVWCVRLKYKEDHEEMEEDLNFVINHHMNEIQRIYKEI